MANIVVNKAMLGYNEENKIETGTKRGTEMKSDVNGPWKTKSKIDVTIQTRLIKDLY